jgi:hypothetical protein
MADIFKVQEVLHFRETTFAEYAETGTPTWTRALVYNNATVSLEQERLEDGSALPRLSDKLPGHPGPRRCSLRLEMYLEGLGTSGAGSITQTAQNILLAGAFGGTKNDAAGTTVSSASSASAFDLTSETNWAAGTIGRMGSKGDGRGDGQAFAWNGTNGTYTALPAQPNNGDVAYGTQHLWMDDSIANPVSERFLVMHSTTGAQFLLVGCAISSVEFSWPIGEIPKVTIEWRGVHWRTVARTFPDSLVPTTHNCAPVAGGSLFVQDVGTTTRNIEVAAEVNLTLDLGLEPVEGGAPAGTFQTATQWARTRRDCMIEIKIPWEDTYQTWWDSINSGLVYKHLLWTATATNTVATGFYARNCFPAGNRPSQVINVRDQNYVSVSLRPRKFAQADTIDASPIVVFSG